jgi:hypothetical protein
VTAGRELLAGHITVALPPEQAYRLFTPRGEQDWAHGWHPTFPVPAADDAEPGTVFETRAHGQRTIWLVTGREPGRGQAPRVRAGLPRLPAVLARRHQRPGTAVIRRARAL